jgi:hypothetical protein
MVVKDKQDLDLDKPLEFDEFDLDHNLNHNLSQYLNHDLVHDHDDVLLYGLKAYT